MSTVLEYKCPCCGAGLVFGEETQKLTCSHCSNTFSLDAVRAFNDTSESEEQTEWENDTAQSWTDAEAERMQVFVCPSCGGEILSDENTAATFCPYCENPTILPTRLSGALKPDGVIPFRTSREDAQKAFLALCKKKPLLPKHFASQQRVEKITGMYVPFWLYACSGNLNGRYNAARVHTWSDSRYNYTRTEHFLLLRDAEADFSGIPMDASSKMDNALMESIEPYDYSAVVDFNTAYLSGFLADKYDVASETGHERIRQRVDRSMEALLAPSFTGFVGVVPTSRKLNIRQGHAKYVLLPVWMLSTKYQDKIYTFVMNGQTGKMTGSFPISAKRSAAWFSGVCAVVAAIAAFVQFLRF